MTTYRVDLGSPNSWYGRDGSDWSGQQYLGLSGLQYLADTVTVASGSANVIHIKGTGDGSKLKSLATDNLSGVFLRGEAVTWDGGSSTGVVSEISANAPIVIEVTAGTLADNDNLVGSTSAATADVMGAPTQKTYGLNIDTNSGSNTSGWIKYIGVNSSGTIDGTYGCIDMNSAQAHAVQMARDMIWLQNIEIKRVAGSGKFGLYLTTLGSGCVHIHCSFHDIAAQPIFGSSAYYNIFYRCCFYACSAAVYYEYSRFLFCSSHDNTANGFSYNQMLFGCLVYDNVIGFESFAQAGVFSFGCTYDDNSTSGISVTSGGLLGASFVVGNRFTNHDQGAGDEGIDANTEPLLYGFNYFENNTDNISNATLAEYIPTDSDADTNEYDQADTNEGYTSLVDGSEDFNLASDATLRRTAISIPIT